MTSRIVKEFITTTERLERVLIEHVALSVVLGFRTYEEGLGLLLPKDEDEKEEMG